MKILSGHQPVYLPSIHLFNKIALSDEFMFVGHCDFGPGTWHQRNRVVLPTGQVVTLTVPVGDGKAIDDVEILENPWRRKHCGTIKQAYAKRPYFKLYYPAIEAIIMGPFKRLGFLNRALVAQICEWFEISTPLLDSYKYTVPGPARPLPRITGKKTQMLIDMCRCAGATGYLSNEGARDYVDEPLMERHKLDHFWQKFEHPVYDQGLKEFVPNMSAIDILFNLGPAAGAVVKSCGDFE